jgi:hypothetical protein
MPTLKTETSQINNLIMHRSLLEKQEQTKPKTTRQAERNNKDPGLRSMRLR